MDNLRRARELMVVARELTGGGVKRWLEEVSEEMGLEGEITEAVMKEAQKRMKKVRVKRGSMNREFIARELVAVAKELVARIKEQAIRVDWNDPRSVREAENLKRRLEDKGYELVQTVGGFTTSELIYEKVARELTAVARELTAVQWMSSYLRMKEKAERDIDDALKDLGFRSIGDFLNSGVRGFSPRDVQPLKDALIALSESLRAIARQAEAEDNQAGVFSKELKKRWPRF